MFEQMADLMADNLQFSVTIYRTAGSEHVTSAIDSIQDKVR